MSFSISMQWNPPLAVQSLRIALTDGMKRVLEESAEEIVRAAERAAQERAGSKSGQPRLQSGRYRQSLRSRTEKTPLRVTGVIASDHPQAAVLEFGSPPHIIRARNKQTLFWPGARFPVRQVNHPGTPAFRVLGGSVDAAVADAPGIVSQALARNFE